ncbi:hypothetical protein Tco_0594926 [Tanacetum coccineum]
MAFSDSEVNNDKSCTKTCLKTYETLKKQCDDLIVKLNQTEFKATTYKRGLTTVEEQLVTYRKNEVLFSEEVAVLKREVACKDYEISVLKSEFEKVKQEKEGIEFKIEKFDNASKSLDKLLGSQITDKSKKGLGYNAVPPPHHLIYNAPTKLDLSYSGLDEFKEPEFKSYGPRDSNLESNIDKKSDNSKENTDDSLVKEQVSENENSSIMSPLNVDKETVFPADKKIEGNQRKWNGQKSNELGSDFVMYNKACFVCGSFDHLQINCHHHQRKRMVSGNNYNRVDYDYYAKTSHPSAHRNMVPRAVLLKSGLTPLNTARPVYTAQPKPTVHSARSMSHFFKQAQSTDQRHFYKKTTLTNRYFHQKVNNVMGHCYTVRPKAVNTARPYTSPVNVVRAKRVNVVKTSTCWIWRPTRPNGASLIFKRNNYIDARDRSNEFEKFKQEKDGIDFKIEKFDKASKDLDQLLGSQITDKSKNDLGYSTVPPPHPLIYNRPKKLDLSYSGLDEFKEPEFKGYSPENSEQGSNDVCDKKSDNYKENSDESLVEEQVSQDKSSFVESSLNVDKETVFPVNKKVEFTKPENYE